MSRDLLASVKKKKTFLLKSVSFSMFCGRYIALFEMYRWTVVDGRPPLFHLININNSMHAYSNRFIIDILIYRRYFLYQFAQSESYVTYYQQQTPVGRSRIHIFPEVGIFGRFKILYFFHFHIFPTEVCIFTRTIKKIQGIAPP